MENKYNYKALSKQELEKKFIQMKNNIPEARETIILHNLKLVFHRYYKRFSSIQIDMDDIISNGIIGLIKAVDTFNLDKNYSFTTYASKCIDNEILMYIRKGITKDIHLEEDNGEDELTLMGLIIDPSVNIEEDYINNENINNIRSIVNLLNENINNIRSIVNLLNEKDKYLYNLYFEKAYSQVEIAKILKKSQSYISREIKSLVYKLEKLMYQNGTIERPKIKNKCIGYNKKNVL